LELSARLARDSHSHRWSDLITGEQRMTRTFAAALGAVLIMLGTGGNAGATSRIKDLANVEGVRQNQLIGYGLVVGLNGTGDTLNNIPFTKQSLQAMLERLGVNIRGATIRTGNVAAVMVTGNLPPFGTQGTRIDVTVSALGDAKSLQGSTLLVTPLLGADGNVYAVAQGSLAIGGFQAEGDAAKITRGVPGAAQHGARSAKREARNGAPQNRDRYELRAWNDPGSAARRFRVAPFPGNDALNRASETEH
jgi:flagellar basal body P-ring protein FlgI